MLEEIKKRLFGEPVKAANAVKGPQHGVVMYSTRFCSYCMQARALLSSKGVGFTDIGIDGNPTLRSEMIEKSQNHTVPQIWIGEQHIGGCDELFALERMGQLEPMLNAISMGDEDE